MSDDTFLLEIQDDFLRESVEVLQKAEMYFLALEKPGDHSEVFAQLKRIAHNFKGSGKAVGFDALSSFSHRLENLLIALSVGEIELSPAATQLLLDSADMLAENLRQLQMDKKTILNHDLILKRIEDLLAGKIEESVSVDQSPNQEQPVLMQDLKTATPEPIASDHLSKINISQASKDESIRVPLKKIDDILDSFGEQIIYLSALDHYKENLDSHKDELVRTIFNLKKLAFEIQQSTLSLRMVTLKSLFSKLERAVRDASKMTSKEINCVLVGSDQELDKIIVDQLSDPLTHMVRNAVDHGIEDADFRQNQGKSKSGTICITAKREGSSFIIEIMDDGKGLDPEKIKAKAIQKGLLKEGETKSESQIFDLIFENGFSTKENVSEISGRGVGMNVVKEMILALKGSYEIESKVGVGTTFRLKLPLSLSLFNAILIQCSDSRYLIPSPQVLEIIKAHEIEVQHISADKKIAKIRDQVIELVDFSRLIGVNTSTLTTDYEKMILISESNGRTIGYMVDRVLSIQKIVQKPLSPEMLTCPGAVGVTILGDGAPALIIDLKALAVTQENKISKSQRVVNI